MYLPLPEFICFGLCYIQFRRFTLVFPGELSSEEPTCKAGDEGDEGLILGLGKSSGGGHGNPLLYS